MLPIRRRAFPSAHRPPALLPSIHCRGTPRKIGVRPWRFRRQCPTHRVREPAFLHQAFDKFPAKYSSPSMEPLNAAAFNATKTGSTARYGNLLSRQPPSPIPWPADVPISFSSAASNPSAIILTKSTQSSQLHQFRFSTRIAPGFIHALAHGYRTSFCSVGASLINISARRPLAYSCSSSPWGSPIQAHIDRQ